MQTLERRRWHNDRDQTSMARQDDQKGQLSGADEDPERAYDNALIRRVANGDRAAFETLYYRHSGRICGYLTRMLRDRELAEEALNDTLVAIWQNAAKFDFRARLTSWMFGIAHNKGLKALSKAARNGRAGQNSDELETIADPDTPERALSRRQSVDSLARALDKLSSEHRLVLELAFIDGLSYAEIADVTDCPVNTVKTRVFHARRRLASFVAEREHPVGQRGHQEYRA